MGQTPVAKFTLEPERPAYSMLSDEEPIVTWPSDLDEHGIFAAIVGVLQEGRSAEWQTEIIANDRVMSIGEYLSAEETYLEDNVGIVRLNAGDQEDGLSVSAVITDGRIELQGVYGKTSTSLARAIVSATILAPGRQIVDELIP